MPQTPLARAVARDTLWFEEFLAMKPQVIVRVEERVDDMLLGVLAGVDLRRSRDTRRNSKPWRHDSVTFSADQLGDLPASLSNRLSDVAQALG